MVKHYALGGTWSTMASRLLYTQFQMISSAVFTYAEAKRNIFFYMLFPFAIVFIIFAFPITLIPSFGNLEEEANNHLFVFKK